MFGLDGTVLNVTTTGSIPQPEQAKVKDLYIDLITFNHKQLVDYIMSGPTDLFVPKPVARALARAR
jgi:hypothetical protein